MFLRKPALARDPLPMTMTGVRLGERVLQIGLDDPALASALASKAGLTGQAAIAVPDADLAERARNGAAHAGVLLEVHVTPIDALPFPANAFDVVVLHGVSGFLARLDEGARGRMLHECHRVLRIGGRAVSIEATPRTGISALLRAGPKASVAYDGGGGASAAMEVAGFRPVRVLAEREGFKFTEGLKSADQAS